MVSVTPSSVTLRFLFVVGLMLWCSAMICLLPRITNTCNLAHDNRKHGFVKVWTFRAHGPNYALIRM
mgnify:FL=1